MGLPIFALVGLKTVLEFIIKWLPLGCTFSGTYRMPEGTRDCFGTIAVASTANGRDDMKIKENKSFVV